MPFGDRRGFALIAVLLVLAILGVLGAEFAYSMRLEAAAVRGYQDSIRAGHLAEAAVNQAIREIAANAPYVTVAGDGRLTFYGPDRLPLPRLPRTRVALGPGEFSYTLTDEEGRMNINLAPADRLDRLFQALGVEKVDRDVMVDSILDWIDPDELHRLNGAESDDYYLQLPVPYRAHNARLDSTAELLQIHGITPAIFNGTEDKPALVDAVTVKTPGAVNINTAGLTVLRALGLSDADIDAVVQTRRDGPYTVVPGTLAGRGFETATRTFRIEAEGWIDGQVRARLTAIVQRQGSPAQPSLAVLEWSGIR